MLVAMEDKDFPRYSDWQMFTGLLTALALGTLTGAIIGASLASRSKQNRHSMWQSDDWQKYFQYFQKAAKTVMKDLPELLKESKTETSPPTHQLTAPTPYQS